MMHTSITSPEQRTVLARVMSELMISFPDLDFKKIVAGPLAEFAYGTLPSYSNLTVHKVTNVATAMVGSGVVCYANDPLTRQPLVMIIKRGDKGPEGEDRFGITGGFTTIDWSVDIKGEQPTEGAVRELREEIVDADGRPILDIDPARLCIVETGIDYRAARRGGLPTQYNGHVIELTPSELARVRQHINKLDHDLDYQQAVGIQSKGEVAGVLLIPLADAIAIDLCHFTHPHEVNLFKHLQGMLAQPRETGALQPTRSYLRLLKGAPS
jgi:hypothetical protein